MNSIAAIRHALDSTENTLSMFIGDLSDADLLVRPVSAANHIAWQLGHLIVAEQNLLKAELPGAEWPELPVGFSQQHSKETAAQEPPKGFGTKERYLELFHKTRAATIANLGKLTEAQLDKPAQGVLKGIAPTLGAMFLLICEHTTMHAGQFTVVRRKLGKPILF